MASLRGTVVTEGHDGYIGQRNTTTEFLPPLPHLLLSDEEDDHGQHGGKVNSEVVTKRGPSVADSIQELQRRGTDHWSPQSWYNEMCAEHVRTTRLPQCVKSTWSP